MFTVLRPKLPSDFLGPTIGSFEDSLLSLFTYATQIATSGSKKCIVILDDIEHILGQSFGEDGGSGGSSNSNSNSNNNTINKTTKSNESHSMIRIRGTFFGLVNELKRKIDQRSTSLMNNLLILCTARSKGDGSTMNDKRWYQ